MSVHCLHCCPKSSVRVRYILQSMATAALLALFGLACDNSVSGYDLLDAGFVLVLQEAAAIQQCKPHVIIAILTVMVGAIVSLITIGILSDKLQTFVTNKYGSSVFTEPVTWIQLSTIATLHRGPSGHAQLSIRMVNGRGTRLINPHFW